MRRVMCSLPGVLTLLVAAVVALAASGSWSEGNELRGGARAAPCASSQPPISADELTKLVEASVAKRLDRGGDNASPAAAAAPPALAPAAAAPSSVSDAAAAALAECKASGAGIPLESYFRTHVDAFFREGGQERVNNQPQLSASSIVLDVGAYTAVHSSGYLAKYGCSLVLFEPVPAFAAELRARYASDARVQVLQYGIGTENKKAQLAIKGDSSSTLFDAAKARATNQSVVEVELRTLDGFFADFGTRDVDLLFVNCEGCEYAVLEYIVASGWVRRMKRILVQFHILLPDALERRCALRAGLGATHEEAWNWPFVWEEWNLRPQH